MPSPHTYISVPSSSSNTASTTNHSYSSTPPSAFAGPSYSSPSPRTVVLQTRDPGGSPSQLYHYQSGYDHPSATNVAYTKPHIPSGAPVIHSTQAFFTASLPRTSSLLPPPRITADLAPDLNPPTSRYPLDTSTAPEHILDSGNGLEPPRARRHSRSSSAGGVSDGFRNLNRWSQSTVSSKASNLTSFSRRMSVDVLGYGSPRKLQKNRPSASSESSRAVASRPRGVSTSSVPPLQSLPQITLLPSLEQEVKNSTLAVSSATQQRPNHTRRPSDDPGLYWNGASSNTGDATDLSLKVENSRSAGSQSGGASEGKMPYTQNGDPRVHSRSRSTGAKGSGDTTSSTRSRERDRERDRERGGKQPSQKAMLSKALQKANIAVQLDNEASFEGARKAYGEACDLLQQVLQRTSGEEDRNKLEAIRQTYTSRIEELDQLLPPPRPESKELPATPEPADERPIFTNSNSPGSGREEPTRETISRNARERAYSRESQSVPSYSIPTSAVRRQYENRTPTFASESTRNGSSAYLSEQYSLQSSFSKTPMRFDGEMTIQPPPPMDTQYMPPPLSPRRPKSSGKPATEQESPEGVVRADFSSYAPNRLAPSALPRGHQRGNSHESISWLDPIDESGGSTASSVHSRTSSLGVRRRHIRAASGDTEAEFDAALDDAIEAAYNDGYELEHPPDGRQSEDVEETVARALRKVERARERVRESEREALELANERERKLREQFQEMEEEEERSQTSQSYSHGHSYSQDVIVEDFYDGNDSDEEERILEEMTRGYVVEDFSLDGRHRSVPRESDSSGLTSRTWHSSMGSNPPTSTTVLTTLSENTVMSNIAKLPGPLPPPPSQALPQIPQQAPSGGPLSKESVRNRRLSGQNPKQLKIETAKLPQSQPPATAAPYPLARTGSYIAQQRQALSAGVRSSSRPSISPMPGVDLREETATPLPFGLPQDDPPRSGSPGRPGLRKNASSTSLKSMKARNLSVSHIDDASDVSPGTPHSNPFGAANSSRPALPSLPTPVAVAFKGRMNNSSTGGLYLFDSDFHSPGSPKSPTLVNSDSPATLEPCPSAVSLRPFWLMRCLYQTLCHPRGGYISNKLFVPRDVWRVKGVKLKNIEDKIANCDMLTAALQRLSRVDTCDADAVLEEMQALEGVLEQVQAGLLRKLGNEVGVQGTSTMFKEASTVDVEPASSGMPRSTSIGGKGSSFSWRRLRSKNSSAGLATAYGGKGGSGGASTNPIETGKDMFLPSLPMATQPTSRPPKRDFLNVQFGGPNAQYMSSLARLFDAAQAIDQIARQVEDPGLRHADKTQVGLELCTRHAAEFFGFYICRFVLTDLTLLLDKFIKRGSEWVLA